MPPSTNGELKHLAFIGARTRKRYLVGRWPCAQAREAVRSLLLLALAAALIQVPVLAVDQEPKPCDRAARTAGPGPLAVERQSYLVDSSFNAYLPL